MNEIYEDAINYLKYYGETNNSKIENIAYFLDCELKSYNKLKSNWTSLREWVKTDNTVFETNFEMGRCVNFKDILDKMNELEGR